MNRRWLPPAAALRDLPATLGILRDSRALSRLRFLRAAERLGLIEQLQTPRTVEELAGVRNVTNVDLLKRLLDVGVAVGELRVRRDRYGLRGHRIRGLAAAGGDARSAFIGELVEYRADVYRELPTLLFGGQPGGYLDRYDELIARSSLLLEPYIGRFVRAVLAERPTRSLLEIGCGTGVYARHAAEAGPELRVVGVDMAERVAALAAANFAQWGLADRCTAVHADIRAPDTANLGGPFDMITLHNNVYYFAPAERESLFVDLRGRLAPGGRLVLTSMFVGKILAATEFDLVLGATAHCWPLPEREELRTQLEDAGYRAVTFHRLLPTEPLFGVTAQAT